MMKHLQCPWVYRRMTQIEHKMLSSAIEKAQKKIEGNNFGSP